MSKLEKKISVGLVVCFVAMIAVVGAITFNQYGANEEQEKLAEAEHDLPNGDGSQESDSTQMTNTEHIQAEIQKQIELEGYDTGKEIVQSAPETEPEVVAEVQSEALVFSPSDTLQWPIEGNVILNYSMEQSIYFSTLDQYKYNPAIVISGNVGDEVRAAGTGKVTSVKEDAQTGMTVTMDIGSGYELIIGQLDGVRVEEGQTVNKGELIGYVAEPSKYYVVEGPNVYFQMLKDGEPVNPLEYMGA